MKKKICILAGDSSGDIYAGDLLEKLSIKYPEIQAEGIAGDLASKAGMKLWKHSKSLNFMGFYEVVCEYKKIISTWRMIKTNLSNNPPDLLILIDYPGLNMRVAKWAKHNGIKVFYYIPPQVWAWGRGRVRKLRAYVDHLVPLYPHESDYFNSCNLKHIVTKHPLLDVIKINSLRDTNKANTLNILIMPGSRKQEVHKHLHDLLSACSQLQAIKKRKVVAYVIKAPTPTELDNICTAWSDKLAITIVSHKDKYAIFDKVHAACVVSGTASLEVALASIPLLVVYKSGWINYMLFSWILFLRLRWISLPNLIAQKSIVKELYQKNSEAKSILSSLISLLFDEKIRMQAHQDLQSMRNALADASAGKTIEDEVYDAIVNQP